MGHEFVDAGHVADDLKGFLAGEDGGKPLGAFGRGRQDGFDFFVEDFAVEEEDGGEGLVLGGGGNVAVVSEVKEEGLDFGGAHFEGVAFAVEEDVAAHPVKVGLFGAIGVVFEVEGAAGLFE